VDTIKEDNSDMKEFESLFNKIDINSDEPVIAEIKRMLIQEKGEEDYGYLYRTKLDRIKNVIEDEFTREELINRMTSSTESHTL
jgi:hypothetical protein